MKYPISYAALRWLEVVFEERLGFKVQILHSGNAYLLRIPSIAGEIVFEGLLTVFSDPEAILPCSWWFPQNEWLHPQIQFPLPCPGTCEIPRELIIESENGYTIHYDVIGLFYWVLTRVEELHEKETDHLGRFPARASHAFIHNYLDRPIVDEWFLLLRSVMARLWPGLMFKAHTSSLTISCDLDAPFSRRDDIAGVMRSFAGNLVKRGSLSMAIQSLKALLRDRSKLPICDPYYKGIKFIYSVNELKGRDVTFFMIPSHTGHPLDGYNEFLSRRSLLLIKEIIARGHNIGIHPGCNTMSNISKLSRSVNRFSRTIGSSYGRNQHQLIGRQHCLRWNHSTTPLLYHKCGITNDSSIGYAELPGFRCGTCHSYPLFDAKTQSMLNVREFPLIVMDDTIFSPKYMNCGFTKKGEDVVRYYWNKCRSVDGNFVLLWHNSSLVSTESQHLYRRLFG